jgi:RimJ/RimL family protein N-acetyltransferase
MEPFPLVNEHVHLSAPSAGDVDRVTEVCQDDEVQRWTTVPSPYTRADAESFVTGFVRQGWETGSDLTWAVRPAHDPAGPLQGMVGVSVADGGGERTGEIGFWAAPEARGRGLITEAARIVTDLALDPEGLGLVRVQWLGYVGNWPSRRVAWKVGFRFEGTLRRFADQRGVRRDAWVASLLPDDPREPGAPWPAEAPVR